MLTHTVLYTYILCHICNVTHIIILIQVLRTYHATNVALIIASPPWFND